MAFIIKTREKTITDNGQEILYGLKMRSTPPTPNNLQRITIMKDFFRDRIYKNEGLPNAPPGLYTWILKSDGNFYAAKTFTKQELGTLHINLKMLTNNIEPSPVDAAGELQINNDGTVDFNLLSGTYMKSKSKSELRRKMSNVINKLATFGISANFLESSASNEGALGGKKLIEATNIRTSPENIEMLNRYFERRGGTRSTRRKIRNRKTHKRK